MSIQSDNYPFQIKDLSHEEAKEIFKEFTESIQEGFLRVGPKSYLFPKGFREELHMRYIMKVRPSDTWVISFPKCGTTWTQELVWMVCNNFDYKKAEDVPLVARFPFMEASMLMNSPKGRERCDLIRKEHPDKSEIVDSMSTPGWQTIEKVPSPRYIKSHLPLTLLPTDLLEKNKVVYVARDPRDVAVSYFHHSMFFKNMGYTGEFKAFWNLFMKDMLIFSPFFEHVKEAWEQRNHQNMLFLFYEDLLKDLPAAVKQVADFLSKTVTEEQLTRVCDYLDFQNFKNNKSVNFELSKEIGLVTDVKKSFIRKGKAGGWREYFDDEMVKQADEWIEENLSGTDLVFPSIEYR